MNVRMIAETSRLAKPTVPQIVTEEFQMWKICAKLIPRILTEGQKENHESISDKLLECVTSDPNFFKRGITVDEK